MPYLLSALAPLLNRLRNGEYLQGLSIHDLDARVESGDGHIDSLSLGVKLWPLVGRILGADLLGDGGEGGVEGVEAEEVAFLAWDVLPLGLKGDISGLLSVSVA